MESSKKILATSLPVPSVQELAKDSILTVPSRYQRLDLHPPATNYINTEPPTVPVIDLQKLLTKQTADEELELVHSTCKEWGFFQLINHGIGVSLMESVKLEARNLFNMSLEEKMILKQKESLQGFGQAFVVSDEQKLDWSDAFILTNNPVDMRNPYYFEHLPPSFREALENYCSQLHKVAITLFRLMARALKLDEEKMEELFYDGYQSCRINYYPPCPQPEHVIGISAHCDAGGLTLLIQADDTQGLEVAKDGKWVPIKPLPNAIIANVGGIIEVLSNGVYSSNLHRATVNSEHERISVVAFHSPSFEKEIGPAKSLIDNENPPLFKHINVGNYYKEFFTRELKDKSILDHLKI